MSWTQSYTPMGGLLPSALIAAVPVAVLLCLLAFTRLQAHLAAGLALIGNPAPVAFGALGTPILALAKVTAINEKTLSAMVGRQLPPFSLIIPFWLVSAMCGWRRMLEVWPACLTAGFTFAVVQFIVSNYHGPWVVD